MIFFLHFFHKTFPHTADLLTRNASHTFLHVSHSNMNGSRPRSEKIKVKSENDSENLSRSWCVELGREHKKINWKFYFSILAIGREKFCFLLRVFFFSLRVLVERAMRIYEILCLLIFDGCNLCCHIAGTLFHRQPMRNIFTSHFKSFIYRLNMPAWSEHRWDEFQTRREHCEYSIHFTFLWCNRLLTVLVGSETVEIKNSFSVSHRNVPITNELRSE